ncbi:MAG: MFS transporter, partial [Clostridia bacterium]|nr:MFS transporter [Clostridia bacterium]
MTHLLLIIIYLAFISLGLPDSALGAAWPSMYGTLDVPVSYAGIISMLIALITTGSSLISHRLTAKLGTAKVTAISAASTAIALMGFSVSDKFWQLCLWTL